MLKNLFKCIDANKIILVGFSELLVQIKLRQRGYVMIIVSSVINFLNQSKALVVVKH
jgi:hypothetical protein